MCQCCYSICRSCSEVIHTNTYTLFSHWDKFVHSRNALRCKRTNALLLPDFILILNLFTASRRIIFKTYFVRFLFYLPKKNYLHERKFEPIRYNLPQLFLNFNVYEPSVIFLFCSSNAANATTSQARII
jgi:hypothetical protein